ncbi:hypothetical protein CFC21_090108 [Triticum aestivum]|uniref:Uncharacterized protein n=2 Tax=Triticum aestivum TaxID=4565 RepID=A0A3B6PSM2_WHEAT|nr:hypothetical protein CFC21_090108 [Triticum aestivum]
MGAMIMPMIQNLEATLRNNAAPQTMQFVPTPASLSVPKPAAATATATATSKAPTSSTTAAAASPAPTGSSSKQEEEKKVEKQTPEKAAAAAAAPTVADPLGSARGKVQEEVMREFAALMASGTLRASEAAALAMRRVMECHGDGVSMQA